MLVTLGRPNACWSYRHPKERVMAQLLLIGAVLLVAGSAIHVVTALAPRDPHAIETELSR